MATHYNISINCNNVSVIYLYYSEHILFDEHAGGFLRVVLQLPILTQGQGHLQPLRDFLVSKLVVLEHHELRQSISVPLNGPKII